MKSLLKAECYKHVHSYSYWLFFLSSAILSFVLSFGEGNHASTSEILTLSLANIPLIMIIAYIFAALSIGEEFRNKTILAYIASGHDRRQVILTKYLIFILLSEILVIVPIFLNALIGAKLFSDHPPLRASVIISVIESMFLFASTCTVAFAISSILRDTGRSLLTLLSLYFFTIFILNTPKAEIIAHFIPLGGLKLVIENSTSISEILLIGGSYLLGFLWISIRYFCRSEIK